MNLSSFYPYYPYNPSIIKQNSMKTHDSYCLWPLYDFLSLKNDLNVASNSKNQKNLLSILKVTNENSRIWSRIGSRIRIRVQIC